MKKRNILTWTFRVYDQKKKKYQIDTNQVISLPTRLLAKTKFETCVGFDYLKKADQLLRLYSRVKKQTPNLLKSQKANTKLYKSSNN